jgi:DNA adenine methylase
VSDRTSDMAISALAPWFGSKRTLAPLIVEELGDHHTYFEPFCGSMAVLLSKPKVRMEAVNDLHGDLINLARVIQHAQLGPALYRRCRRMWMVEGLFREAAARWKVRGVQSATESPDLDRAADFFFTSWVGRNGVVGTQSYNQSFAARYTPGGGHGGTRWQSAVGSIAAWRRRLEDVTVLNRDGFKLLTKIGDEPGVAVYCDPPYLVKGAEYVFDFKREDHARLAEELARFRKARVVVSYYAHPLLDELYRGWTVREVPTTKAMVCGNGRGTGAVVAPEVLIINGPSVSHEEHLFAGGAA